MPSKFCNVYIIPCPCQTVTSNSGTGCLAYLASMESELGRTCLLCPNKGEELGTGELKQDLVTGLSLFQGNPISKCQALLICQKMNPRAKVLVLQMCQSALTAQEIAYLTNHWGHGPYIGRFCLWVLLLCCLHLLNISVYHGSSVNTG